MGVRSTLLALEDLKKNYNFSEAEAGINYLKAKIREKLNWRGQIIADESLSKNTNTVFFIIKGKDS